MFNDADKHVFEGEAAFPGADHAQAIFRKPPDGLLDGARGAFFRDHMQAFAKRALEELAAALQP